MLRSRFRNDVLSPRFSSLVRPAASTALLVLLVVAVGGFIISPILHWQRANQQELEDGLSVLGRLQSVVRQPLAQDAGLNGAQLSEEVVDFLVGQQDTLVTADLQTRLRALIVDQSAELSSVRVLPAKMVDGLTFLGLNLQLRGEFKKVHRIIYAIETQRPLLFIERAQVRVEEHPLVSSGPAVETEPVLFADLDVFGARWSMAPPAELDKRQ